MTDQTAKHLIDLLRKINDNLSDIRYVMVTEFKQKQKRELEEKNENRKT